MSAPVRSDAEQYAEINAIVGAREAEDAAEAYRIARRSQTDVIAEIRALWLVVAIVREYPTSDKVKEAIRQAEQARTAQACPDCPHSGIEPLRRKPRALKLARKGEVGWNMGPSKAKPRRRAKPKKARRRA